MPPEAEVEQGKQGEDQGVKDPGAQDKGGQDNGTSWLTALPEDIREKYQYYTEANMGKLRSIGYETPFTSLEAGVNQYVKNYLIPKYG